MDMPRVRMLRAALDIVETETALAAVLHADADKVHAWLIGEERIPTQEFFAVLDLVAQWPVSDPRVH